LLGAPDE
jgi:hypothetical protein